MSLALSESEQTRLKQWIETSLASASNTLAAGYQGQALLYRDEHRTLVIKVPHGSGLVRWLHVRMLHHENAVYRKLRGFPAAPACYGLIDNQYLVLEYIQGKPIRDNRPLDEHDYFARLFTAIEDLHRRGIAHMDLKKKDNLLVVDGRNPCIIDFGAAVIRRSGFHPLNHIRYALAVRFDYNAWIKHKYHDRLHSITEQDKPYYRQTLVETLARKVKRFYLLFIKRWFR